MKTFTWCPLEGIANCAKWWPPKHSHICIRSIGAVVRKSPSCDNPVIYMDFHDLDPEAIKRTGAFAKDPDKGEAYIKGCMQKSHAREIVKFVKNRPDDELIVVNCEAGVSRSPGVVLALRRFYGGDTEEPFNRAVPNIYVTTMVTKALRGRKKSEG